MSMHWKHLLPAGLAVALLTGACKKDEDPDLKDPVPSILSVTVSPGTVKEYEDEIVFTVNYRDGDGDLGENEPNAENLFLVDDRINVTERYRIRELAPAGAEIPITGNLRVVLPSTGITNGTSSQSVTYTIYVRDRAGNESNHFTTNAITVVQ